MKKILVSLMFICSMHMFANDNFDDEFDDTQKSVFDPLSGYNRFMTYVNDKIYIYLFDPIAGGYGYVVPERARYGISNIFENIAFPMRFINNILQLKINKAFIELTRFGVNSTAGLFGIYDVAKERYNLYPSDEDLGQTFGHYGIGGGFHIVLPFFGPSNLRDTVGTIGDGLVDPMSYKNRLDYAIPSNGLESVGLKFFKQTNTLSFHRGKYENLKKDAIDIYPFFRDIYEKKRENLIKE